MRHAPAGVARSTSSAMDESEFVILGSFIYGVGRGAISHEAVSGGP